MAQLTTHQTSDSDLDVGRSIGSSSVQIGETDNCSSSEVTEEATGNNGQCVDRSWLPSGEGCQLGSQSQIVVVKGSRLC